MDLDFQLIREMKGFAVRCAAHGVRRLALLAARHELRFKVHVVVQARVCRSDGADKKIVNTG